MNGTGHERVETRVSLVLYGGVSLAVYIGGTCQELLSVVRATASDPHPNSTRTEAAYRQLAEHAGEDRQPMKVSVDVISGSSAGGLNAVFLGKALTQGGSLDGLTEIWRREADFLRLLNDSESPAPDGITLPLPTRPTGVLNGDRFFLMLLDALERMDIEAAEELEARGLRKGDLRLVPAVDCFLTTTDLRGVAERVQLHRSTITELRHRGRFHFRDGNRSSSGRSFDDLDRSKNHLLAFAARATAAFPGAFHPAQWEQTMSLPMERAAGAMSLADNFIPSRGPDKDVDVKRRWYSDGGVMDNKPFAYALEPLTNRRADVPVDRRVMYVEPDPNSSVDGWEDDDFPTLDKYTIGTYPMGRAENIREDVATLNHRNEAVSRLNGSVQILFTRDLDDVIEQLRQTTGARDADPADLPRVGLDLEYSRDDEDRPDAAADEADEPRGIIVSWKNMSQRQHAAERGWGAVAAEEFRWNSVVTDLVVTSLQIGNKTPDAAAVGHVTGPVRHAIEAWIRNRTDDSVNVVRVGLYMFDVGYRLRRFTLLEHLLSYVQRQLNAGTYAPLDSSDERFEMSSPDERFEQCRVVRSRINELYLELRSKLEEQRTINFRQVLGVDSSDWGDEGPDIERLLKDEAFTESLDRLITQIEHGLSLPLKRASVEGREAILDADIDIDLRLRLADAWLNYGDYDQLILPLAEVANAELDAAEVIRISPLDAPSLVDELRPTSRLDADGEPLRRRKLGGNSLAHFGGFLDENWRLNDVLWGRLDAAEVIVRSILLHPDDDPTEAIAQAHRAILSDLAEGVARGRIDRSPLRALLEVNAENGSRQHLHASTQLNACAALNITDESESLTADQDRVIDDTATSFLQLLGNHDDTPSWSVDLSMDDVRSSRGQDKIALLRRGARVAGKVLSLAGEEHYQIDSGDLGANTKQRSSYALVGSLLVNTVTVAIGGHVRRLIVTGLLALIGLAGLALTVTSANRGGTVVLIMFATSLLGGIGLWATQQDPSRVRTALMILCGGGVAGGIVGAFTIDWLTASACIVFFTLLGLALAFWFAVGWIRTALIELGNPKRR